MGWRSRIFYFGIRINERRLAAFRKQSTPPTTSPPRTPHARRRARARTHKIATARICQLMSGSPPRAAEKRTCGEVRVGPIADMNAQRREWYGRMPSQYHQQRKRRRSTKHIHVRGNAARRPPDSKVAHALARSLEPGRAEGGVILRPPFVASFDHIADRLEPYIRRRTQDSLDLSARAISLSELR